MAWKHYTQTVGRRITAFHDGAAHQCVISIGRAYTGKQRVFVGYFCKVECDGTFFINEHSGSIHQALLFTLKEFKASGYSVNLYGLQKSFRESGLSWNTGFGYVPKLSAKPLLMIEKM